MNELLKRIIFVTLIILIILITVAMVVKVDSMTFPVIDVYVDSYWNVICYYTDNAIDCIPLQDLGVDY